MLVRRRHAGTKASLEEKGPWCKRGFAWGMQAAWELVHAEEKGHLGVAGCMKKNGPSRLARAEIWASKMAPQK